ncbi:HxsD-like protein [Desulfosporosinus shakirovi]|uniref:HxsD-like protein n=1 Tax=Desulfosporosinus shakirovi TaxID=2885154 RepID=UPI001E51B79C|nr:HxsD-like protein [Desulfosporosinus sp. SRJS8]MCB8818322.1 HxsD-like protein [Desulfosporosinus sp. SRJS8]
MIITLDTRIYPLECINETIEAFRKLVSVKLEYQSPTEILLTCSCDDGNVNKIKDEFLNYLLAVVSVSL